MKYFEDNPNTETILAEKELIKRVKDERERVDLLGLATMVAFRKFKDSIIKDLFYKEFDMLKESSFVKEWVQEGWEKGRVEGHEKGHEEGHEEGRVEGLRDGEIRIIIKLLERTLGRVSANLENKIRSLDDKDIERLSDDLFSIKKTTDLEQWLRHRDENSKN